MLFLPCFETRDDFVATRRKRIRRNRKSRRAVRKVRKKANVETKKEYAEWSEVGSSNYDAVVRIPVLNGTSG